MILEDSEQKLTEKEFKIFAVANSFSFPKEFIDLYMESNGGFPSHPFINGKEVSYFAPIKYGDSEYTIRGMQKRLLEFGRASIDLIPFANDPGGWVYCLNKGQANYGVIYLVPNGIEDQSPIVVAQNFEEFLDNLSVEDDY